MTPTHRLLALLPVAAALAACGGGGGSGGSTVSPAITGATVTNIKYSRTALVTINGSNLDSDLSVSSPGCSGMTRSTTAPNISSATTAYYTCTVTAVGTQTVAYTRTSNGQALGTTPFSVPMPQVTMAVTNGAAVNGSMVFTLAPDMAPITVNNFLAYVNESFYDGTIFHRVVTNFVIQGGGFLPLVTLPYQQKPPTHPAIALEVGVGLSNVQWSLAMARTNVLNSATSQFFINVVNNAGLDTAAGGYAVFGSVTTNTALAAAIVAAPCTPVTGFSECAPNPNMVITSATQTQ